MEREQPAHCTALTGIHINLVEQAIEFEDRHGTVGRLRFTDATVLYEGQPLLLMPISDAKAAAEQAIPSRPRQQRCSVVGPRRTPHRPR